MFSVQNEPYCYPDFGKFRCSQHCVQRVKMNASSPLIKKETEEEGLRRAQHLLRGSSGSRAVIAA